MAMAIAKQIELIAADLATGDAKARELDFRDLDIARIFSSDDPLFATAYERLWNEFGSLHEMETSQVIKRRLAWSPVANVGERCLQYEMILVQRIRPGEQPEFVAVRDHTAIVSCRSEPPIAVVHLSHVLVDPAWRRTGLSGWLRAWPIQTARHCLAAAGCSTQSQITLVGEMEHPEVTNASQPSLPITQNTRLVRLKAYEKAGFKKIDPRAIDYFQPDFRPAAEIDAGGGPKPLPFGLVVRRVGLEQENVISGREVRQIVESLYAMYGAGFRESDMAVVWRMLESYPADQAEIRLVAPTST